MKQKLLDLRFVIGLFFTVVGILLLLYYFMSTDAVAASTTVNKWCGFGFLVFGAAMITLSSLHTEKAD